MYSETRLHLVRHGFPIKSIRYLCGKDVRASGVFARDLKPNQCCMWAFHRLFLPRVIGLFDTCKTLRVVLWLEDDARLKKVECARSVYKQASSVAPAACRMGWWSGGGHYLYGSHAVAFSRKACLAFQADLDSRETPGKPNAHMYGLDNYWTSVMRAQKDLIQLSQHRMFVQRSHPLQARK